MTHVAFNRKPFQRNFNNIVDELFTDFPGLFRSDAQQWKGLVPVNIIETEKNYQLEVVAPGFEKTDFKVSVDQQLLTVAAEKKQEVKEDGAVTNNNIKKQIRNEYSFKSFKRSFTLDEKIDGTLIEAQYVNGVLTVNLPKKEIVQQSAKEISIQ